MWVGLVATMFGCSSSGPVGTDDQRRLAAEILTAEPSSRTERGWQEEIHPDATLFEALEREANRADKELLATAFLVTGFHPYIAVTFVRAGSGVEVATTLFYWGRVDGKWKSRIPRAAFDSFLEEAGEILSCERGAPSSEWRLEGAALIDGMGGDSARNCRAEWASESAAAFGELLLALGWNEVRTFGEDAE